LIWGTQIVHVLCVVYFFTLRTALSLYWALGHGRESFQKCASEMRCRLCSHGFSCFLSFDWFAQACIFSILQRVASLWGWSKSDNWVSLSHPRFAASLIILCGLIWPTAPKNVKRRQLVISIRSKKSHVCERFSCFSGWLGPARVGLALGSVPCVQIQSVKRFFLGVFACKFRLIIIRMFSMSFHICRQELFSWKR